MEEASKSFEFQVSPLRLNLERSELDGKQYFYIKTIFDYFLNMGKWPTYFYLERFFIKEEPDLDIEEIAKSLPGKFAPSIDTNNPNSPVSIRIPAIALCKNSEEILKDFIILLKHCVDTFFSSDDPTPVVKGIEVSDRYNWDTYNTHKLGLLLQGEPYIWSSFGGSNPQGEWTAQIRKEIRRYRNVKGIEDYLKARDPEATANSENLEAQKVKASSILANFSLVRKKLNIFHGGPTSSIAVSATALSDNPSKKDLLNFSDYAVALADFIKNENTEKPLTIVIDASWGMGKTTLMNMIKKQLEFLPAKDKKQPFPTVWFNAWKYSQESSLWAALALEILSQASKYSRFWQKIQFWWKLNQKRLNWVLWMQSLIKSALGILMLVVLGGTSFLAISIWQGNILTGLTLKQFLAVGGILSIITLFYTIGKNIHDKVAKPFDLNITKYIDKPNYKDRIGFLAEFENDFKLIVETFTQEGKQPLTIFIDDLDRCSPLKAVEIIEAINLLLDSEHCVFVIAMDTQTVVKSIEVKYKELLTDETQTSGISLGQHFLEKIVQVTFHIPRPNASLIESFIINNLNRSSQNSNIYAFKNQLKETKQSANKRLNAVAEASQENNTLNSPQKIRETGQTKRETDFDNNKEVEIALKEVIPFLSSNPRKIKRFINTFRLQTYIANQRGLIEDGTIQLTSLAKWIIITTRWPRLIETAIVNSNFIDQLLYAHHIKGALSYFENPKNSEEELSEEERGKLQAEFDSCTENSYLKSLLNFNDLLELLRSMSEEDIQSLPQYFYLTQRVY